MSDVLYQTEIASEVFWQYLFLVEHASRSQYDVLVALSRENTSLPNGILCLAGSGKKFHGFKNRAWVSLPGNIHLSTYFSPQQMVPHFGAGFMIVAAISVIHALDSLDALKNKAGIKWVNDILIQDAKVCGVLAHTQTRGKLVSDAVLGIGLNVETSPEVEPTIFVPRVASVCDFMRDQQSCNQKILFNKLIYFLQKNYKLLVKGKYRRLLDMYRKRSVIIGRKVKVWSDPANGNSREIMSGKVKAIGNELELYFEGTDSPVTKGRLQFMD